MNQVSMANDSGYITFTVDLPSRQNEFGHHTHNSWEVANGSSHIDTSLKEESIFNRDHSTSFPSVSEPNHRLDQPYSKPTKRSASKRSPNAFILYRQYNHGKIASQNPTFTNSEISKMIGALWANEPEEVQTEWQRKANQLKLEQQTDHPDYLYIPENRRPIRRGKHKGSRDMGQSTTVPNDVKAARKDIRQMPSPSIEDFTSNPPDLLHPAGLPISHYIYDPMTFQRSLMLDQTESLGSNIPIEANTTIPFFLPNIDLHNCASDSGCFFPPLATFYQPIEAAPLDPNLFFSTRFVPLGLDLIEWSDYLQCLPSEFFGSLV